MRDAFRKLSHANNLFSLGSWDNCRRTLRGIRFTEKPPVTERWERTDFHSTSGSILICGGNLTNLLPAHCSADAPFKPYICTPSTFALPFPVGPPIGVFSTFWSTVPGVHRRTFRDKASDLSNSLSDWILVLEASQKASLCPVANVYWLRTRTSDP